MLFFFFFSILLFSPLHFTLSLNQDGLYLQRVKLAFFDPTHSLSSWYQRDDTPCSWLGISCHPTTRRVSSIDLSNLQLAGPFPSLLCRLPSLSSINFSNNFINSTLSALDFSSCRNLTFLDLSDNLLVGPLPEALVNLPNLRHLVLAGNNFSGEIPPTFGRFPQLEMLNLAGNLLNGTIPLQLTNLSTLKVLGLAYNPFLPTQIPPQLGNLTNLEVLWLSGCSLEGQIPEDLSRLTRLVNLDLSTNHLTGPIPTWITELTGIVQIELYSNSFSGELPKGMGKMTSLKRFDASMNELTGTIPAELTGLQLQSLNLYENRLEGPLPDNITRSECLSELKLFNNKLSGPLPNQLGANSPLQYLDLSYNKFSGEIPATLCAKGNLQNLILIYNSFSGEIPGSLGKCQSLTRVRFRNNRLSGEVPVNFWGLPRVYLLELMDNSFTGQISKKISGAHNLSVLLVSKNHFSGSIPGEIGSLPTLVQFSGSENEFSGPIPASLMNLWQLNRLDLSANKLSGGIPEGIRGLKSLNELKLANNKLAGKIPSEIGSLPVLNYLDLSENYFFGKIPLELQNLKLNVLNLSYNQLSGDLPPLYAKDMYKNNFVGNPGLCGDLKGLCPKTGGSKSLGYLWILRLIFVLAAVVFVVGVVWFISKYRKFNKAKKGMAMFKWRSFHKLGFSEFEVLECLKEENVIGSGASGRVYRVELSNGEVVAVKKLFGGAKKDASAEAKRDVFEVEVETLGKIRHKNIVRLWCCCNSGDCKLLVYEYMLNGSLGDLLHGSKGGLLDWSVRYKIALDAAEGLSYLHHDCVPPIVHRDVKSNNILLDGEFGAKVADFGVAKAFERVSNSKGAGSMSVIAGSCGYIAPEYAYTLRVNEKSDIYSFGVVILELVTGRMPTDQEFGEKDLVKWVCSQLEQKDLDGVIDPKLDISSKEEIRRFLNIGLVCTSPLPINRPSMRKVVKMLQEAGAGAGAGADKKPINNNGSKKDGKLSPYYYNEDEASDQGSVI